MPTIDATVYPAQAYVLVQADWSGAVLRDIFHRVVAGDWGAATTGQDWAPDGGGAPNYQVLNDQGQIIHTAASSSLNQIAAVSMLDVDFYGVTSLLVTPTGASIETSRFIRFVDMNNYVRVRWAHTTTGVITAVIIQRIAGVDTFSSSANIPGVAAADVVAWRLQAIGATVRFQAWPVNTPMPQTWLLSFTTTWLTAGAVGVGSFVAAGVTNPRPVTVYHDNLVAYSPSAVSSDCALVTRRNTVTGELVYLRPYIFYDADGALILECGQGLWWDTEPPLNVPLEYCTFACDAAVIRSTNPTFDTDVLGWTAVNSSFAQDCTNAKVGTCSGRMTPNGTNTNPAVTQSGIVLAADSPVTISGWAMSPQGWNSVYLTLVVSYSDLTSETVSTELVTLDDGEWRFLSVSFTPSKSVASSSFSFVAAGLPPNTTLFNVDQLQVTQLEDQSATACETVTVSSESVWLKNPLQPCLDVEIGLCSPMLEDCDEDSRVSYVGTRGDAYVPNTVLLGPANRQFLIPVSRPRRAPAATLQLLAHDCDARDAVLATNAPGTPLLFQAPADYCIPDRYISVDVVEEVKFSIDQREDFRLMNLPYATVQRPEGPADGPCGTRIQDLCDIYTSWAALSIAGFNWTDLMLGEASPDGPGQPEPPAGARIWSDVETEFANWLAVEAGGTRDWGELRDGL